METHERTFHLCHEFLQAQRGMGWVRKRGIDEEGKVKIKGEI
jgi:hypothetical protein